MCACIQWLVGGEKRRINNTLSLFIKAFFGFLKETDEQYAFIKAFFGVLELHTHRHLENLPKDIRLLSLPSKANSRYFSKYFSSQSNIVLCPYQSVCVHLVWVCVCLARRYALLVAVSAFIKLLITLSMTMYTICVMFAQHFELYGRHFTNFRYYY